MGGDTDLNNAYANFMRYSTIKDYFSATADVYEFMQAFPDVNYRYYLQPSTPLPGGLAILNFDNSTSTWGMQMKGRLDGENAIKTGEGFFFNKMMEWGKNETVRAQFPLISSFVDEEIDSEASKWRQARREEDGEAIEDPRLATSKNL